MSDISHSSKIFTFNSFKKALNTLYRLMQFIQALSKLVSTPLCTSSSVTETPPYGNNSKIIQINCLIKKTRVSACCLNHGYINKFVQKLRNRKTYLTLLTFVVVCLFVGWIVVIIGNTVKSDGSVNWPRISKRTPPKKLVMYCYLFLTRGSLSYHNFHY